MRDTFLKPRRGVIYFHVGHGDCSSPASADASAGPGAPAGPASDCLGRHYVGEAHVCGGRTQGTQPARHRVRAEGQRVGTKGPEGPGPRRGRRRGPRGREDLPDGVPLSHARGLGLPRRPTAHGQRGAGSAGREDPVCTETTQTRRKASSGHAAPSGPRERSRPRPPRPDAGETLREPDSARAASRGQSPWRPALLCFRPQGRTAEAAERGLAAPLSQRKEAERFAAAKLVPPAAGRQPRRLQNLPSWRRRWLQAARRVCCQLSRGPAGRAGARTVITS